VAGPLDTIGKAVRHNMLCTVECGCGNIRHYRAIEIGMAIGFGRHPDRVPFKCTACKGQRKPPTISWRLLDENRLPRLTVWRFVKGANGRPDEWEPERLKR
jgi:hypothetical protein